MRRCNAFGFLALGALLVSMPAAAQTNDAPPEVQLFGKWMRGGITFETLMKSVDRDFANLGTGGDAITAGDVAVHERMLDATYRARRAVEIMQKDIDGDGYVTEDEVRSSLAYAGRQSFFGRDIDITARQDHAVEQVMQADTDGDKRVGWAEASAMPGLDTPQGRAQAKSVEKLADSIRQALLLDSDNDGRVTLREYEAAADALFRTVDTNSSGKITEDEARAFKERAKEPVAAVSHEAAEAAAKKREEVKRETLTRGEAAEAEACGMPVASAEAEVIVLGAYGPEALSSVAIGTQDKTVQTGNVNVEAGESPLYVVIASLEASIWRFSGAVERIENVVVTSGTWIPRPESAMLPLAGETGLPAERVTFLKRIDCMKPFWEVPSVAAAKAAALVTEQVGKAPVKTVAHYNVSTFSVPSGAIESLKETAGRWPLIVVPGAGALRVENNDGGVTVRREPLTPSAELKRYNPGGVVTIDVETVVASLPPEPYVVLPEAAGLKQLVDEGALTLNSEGEYLIHRKTRFPAGLYGGHSVSFLLLRGVPMPEGDPGHSTVVSEETGEVLSGPLRH